MKMKKSTYLWTLAIILILALILVPFIAVGEPLEAWMENIMQNVQNRPLQAFLLVTGLLASDVLLPVPSSIVSTLGGAALGTAAGTLASWLGMMISCLIAYWLGRSGRPLGQRLLGQSEIQRLEHLEAHIGKWMIVAVRAVPVLAEASTILAGVGRMRISHFIVLCAIANLGVSLVYAAIGSISGRADAFLPAFGVSILLAAVAIILGKQLCKKPQLSSLNSPLPPDRPQ